MEYNSLPKDPVMLMSYINTKLRDTYPSLDALCEDMHIDKDDIERQLATAGYTYSAEYNRFW